MIAAPPAGLAAPGPLASVVATHPAVGQGDQNRYRGTAVLVAILFLVSTATFIVSNSLITPILGSRNTLAAVADHSHLMIAAALIGLIEGTATVGIAIALYPILKRRHPALALGYTGMRITELVIAAVGFGLGSLVLVTLSTTAAHGSESATLGTLVVALRHWTLTLVYLYTAIGGAMLSYMLLRTRLVPQGLSVLGLIGYPVLLVGTILDMFGATDITQAAGLLAVVPGGLFELILPIWLLVKGFNVIANEKERRLAPNAIALERP